MRNKHCNTCICGLTEVSWSDREGYVDLADDGDIAETIISCAFDHSYDRTDDAIPDGFPDDLREYLAPIVAAELDKIQSTWRKETIWTHDKPGCRQQLKNALIGALKVRR